MKNKKPTEEAQPMSNEERRIIEDHNSFVVGMTWFMAAMCAIPVVVGLIALLGGLK